MEHTAQIELANQADRVAVELGILNPEDIRRLTINGAIGCTQIHIKTSSGNYRL